DLRRPHRLSGRMSDKGVARRRVSTITVTSQSILRLVRSLDEPSPLTTLGTVFTRKVNLGADPLELVVTRSIGEFEPRDWNALFVGEPEDWAYHRAVESAGPAQCSPLYLAIRSSHRLLSAVPAYIGRGTRYGARRSLAEVVAMRARRSHLVLGSPLSDTC